MCKIWDQLVGNHLVILLNSRGKYIVVNILVVRMMQYLEVKCVKLVKSIEICPKKKIQSHKHILHFNGIAIFLYMRLK